MFMHHAFLCVLMLLFLYILNIFTYYYDDDLDEITILL